MISDSDTVLRRERIRRRLSQSAVGYLTELTQSQLSAIENRRVKAGPGQKNRVARYLCLDSGELFEQDGMAT